MKYKCLLADNQRLLAENAQLHNEVEHLKRMLSQNIVPEDNNTDTKVKLDSLSSHVLLNVDEPILVFGE